MKEPTVCHSEQANHSQTTTMDAPRRTPEAESTSAAAGLPVALIEDEGDGPRPAGAGHRSARGCCCVSCLEEEAERAAAALDQHFPTDGAPASAAESRLLSDLSSRQGEPGTVLPSSKQGPSSPSRATRTSTEPRLCIVCGTIANTYLEVPGLPPVCLDCVAALDRAGGARVEQRGVRKLAPAIAVEGRPDGPSGDEEEWGPGERQALKESLDFDLRPDRLRERVIDAAALYARVIELAALGLRELGLVDTSEAASGLARQNGGLHAAVSRAVVAANSVASDIVQVNHVLDRRGGVA